MGVKKTFRAKTGFSLIEVVIALVIVSVVTVGGFEFLRYCRKFVLDSQIKLAALNIVKGEFERTAGCPNALLEDSEEDISSRLPQGCTGTRRVSVTERDDYYIVAITVSWE
jgi:prepilin-type N-terminal cleavage/methylation domain-containing protein